jgi:uncharacterized membrane protein YkvA (DUF1232 family)
MWHIALGFAGGLVLVWVALIAALWRVKGRVDLGEALRVLPDVLRLLKRLAGDPTLPRRVRITLWLLLAYMFSPIDLIPDFIPIIGYADDAIIIVLALRSVVRRSGVDAIRRHWPGTPDGLAVILRLAGAKDRD